jgi:hypothetical protein
VRRPVALASNIGIADAFAYAGKEVPHRRTSSGSSTGLSRFDDLVELKTGELAASGAGTRRAFSKCGSAILLTWQGASPFMVLAVAALFLQLSPVTRALPAAIPSLSANFARTAVAADTKFPDPSSHTATNTTLTPDLATAYTEKKTPSANDPSVTGTANSEPLHSAQNVLALSSIRIQPVEPDNEHQVIQARTSPSRRTWLALSLMQHGAATFDAYSTRRAISRGSVENDPMMRPFAQSPGLYAAIQVGPVLLDFVSRRMQRSQNDFVRRIWWLPQSLGTATFLFSGVHNLNVKGHP